MFKKNLSLFLAVAMLLSLFAAPSALAKTKEEKQAALSAKVKAGVSKLGAGKDTKISVKLRDKTKLKGYVSRIEEESFVIADAKTGNETNVPYGDVTQVKGKNLSTGAVIAISAGVAAAVTLLVIWIIIAAAD
ncbi:MAG TPA: hypothetical protein VJ810_02060 [Blastocatellia bacterium]|nr:hypothetical protein [Blastocatellia bacterium]